MVWSGGTNGQKSSLEEDSVLDALAGAVVEDALLRSSNSVCFAHGVQGSGKTHTMFGAKGCSPLGLLPKIVTILLSRIPSGHRATVSFLELCDEDLVRDLLVPPTSTRNPRRLFIREHPDQCGAFVKDLSEVTIRTIEGLMVCAINC